MRKHISADGQVRDCKAQSPESCTAKGPNGEKAEHFDNVEAARARSEEVQEEKYGAFNTIQKPSKKYTQAELNVLAKTTDDPELIDRAIREGKKRVHSSLASNGNVTTEQIKKIRTMYPNGEMDRTLSHNPNYPISDLTDEQLRRRTDSAVAKQVSEDSTDDALAERILNAGYMPLSKEALIKNPNNQLSSEMVNRIVAKDLSENYPIAKNNPKLEIDKVLDPMSAEKLDSTLWNVDDPDLIRSIHEKINEKDPTMEQGYVAANDNTPADILDNLATNPKVYGEYTQTGYLIYKNPNTSNETKEKLLKNSPVVQSIAKLEKLEETGELNKIYADKPKEGFHVHGQSYYFDPDEVKKAGLTGKDIDNLIRFKKHNHLFGAKYNEETGVYSGYTD